MVSSTVLEWNKLDLNICNSENLTSFKGNILKIIRPSENSVFLYNNLKRIQLLTRLRPGLSHLREHKLKHNFQDTFQDTRHPICNWVRILKLAIITENKHSVSILNTLSKIYEKFPKYFLISEIEMFHSPF